MLTRSPGRAVCATFLVLCLIPTMCLAQSPWGLRNLELVPSWPTSQFQPHAAGHVAFWLPWQTIEPDPGLLNWTALDQRLERVKDLSAIPVIVFHLNAGWANSTEYSGPIDLDRVTPLSQPTPARGYSEILYDVVEALTQRIAANYDGTLYFRCFNEPYLDWGLGGADAWVENVENFERVLRTFYKSAHDVGDAAANLDVLVSHGGVQTHRQLEKFWFEQGQADPSQRPAIQGLMESSLERRAPTTFDTWAAVAEYVSTTGPRGVENQQADLWLEYFLQWTVKGFVDYNDVHYHYKPRFLADQLDLFDAEVMARGGQLKPWLAAEAAMEVLVGETWPLYLNQDFHAQDMARKWFRGMQEGLLASCAPVVGVPNNKYFGLYLSTTQPVSYEADQAFQFLSNLLSAPEQTATLRDDTVAHLRFTRDVGAHVVDALWQVTLADIDPISQLLTVTPPAGFGDAVIYDVVGNVAGVHVGVSSLDLDVSQAPVIVHWLQTGTSAPASRMSAAAFDLFPNPASGSTQLSLRHFDQGARYQVDLFDLAGRRIQRHSLGTAQTTLALPDLAAGVYFVTVTGSGETARRKLVVAR